MDRPLHVAVIGLGFGQQVHVPAFRADSRCEVTTLCASAEAKAADVARRLGVPHASGDWRTVVASPDIDVVSIAVPPRLQPAIAIEALRQGKAVFCEKPLAADLQEARAVDDAAARSGRPNLVNFEFCQCDAWRRAAKFINSDQIGPIISVDVDWRVRTYGNRSRSDNWKSKPEEGGGALNAFVAHTFYDLERIAGSIERVQARLSKAPDDPRPGETEVALEARFLTGGARATVHVATDAPPPHHHRIEIVGRSGVLRLLNEGSDYIDGFRVLYGPGTGATMTVVSSQTAAFDESPLQAADGGAVTPDGRTVATSRLVRKFLNWACDGRPAHPDLADGHRVQFLIEAARRSNAERRWMDALV
jgi:predicted dehydrogenase